MLLFSMFCLFALNSFNIFKFSYNQNLVFFSSFVTYVFPASNSHLSFFPTLSLFYIPFLCPPLFFLLFPPFSVFLQNFFCLHIYLFSSSTISTELFLIFVPVSRNCFILLYSVYFLFWHLSCFQLYFLKQFFQLSPLTFAFLVTLCSGVNGTVVMIK